MSDPLVIAVAPLRLVAYTGILCIVNIHDCCVS
jgi:hypothetical protein